MIRPNSMEVLEARIAPALIIQNPLPDVLVGAGSAVKRIELSQMFDPLLDHPFHTIVTFTLNFDSDPNTPGVQDSVIKLELFDNEAPLTVQNFLRYVESGEFVDTFLHRMVDFQNNGSMDIIQGGGFDVSDIREHIDTFSQVHNEYSNDRKNTPGTIAMAKTGLGPNTGTSEWFVNITDNSTTLGEDNNSGFTVFGQIVEGFDVIQRLAQLRTEDLGGALTNVPVQNFNGKGSPKPSNFVKINSVEIEPTEVGNDAGITYTATFTGADLFQNDGAGNTLPITGSELELLYNAAANGVATITVTASKAGEQSVTETFTVTLRPNLIATVSEDKIGSILLPGEGGVEKSVIKIQNNGGANYSSTGAATIKFYLSAIDNDDPQGSKVDDDDILLHTLTQVLNIDAAGEITLDIAADDLALGPELIKGGTGFYRLIVEVVPAEGEPEQLFTDDDVAVDGSAHVLTNSFGTLDFTESGFGKRTNVVLKYLDPQTDKPVELSLKGPGFGTVTLNEGDKENDTDDQAELVVNGTTSKSKLNIAGLDSSSVTFRNVEVTNFIGLVDFSTVDEIGNVSLSSGAQKVIFGNFNNTPGDTQLVIGGSHNIQPVTIVLGDAKDFSIHSTQRIKSITANSWIDERTPDNAIGGVEDRIYAPSLSSVKIAGNFGADIETFINSRLSTLSVGGSINDVTIRVAGDIGSIKAGDLTDASVIATGGLSNLSVGAGIVKSTIQAGANLGKISATELTESNISTDANLSNLSVGTILKTTIQADGNISKITATTLTESNVSTGLNLTNLLISGPIGKSTVQADGTIKKVTANGLTESNISTNSSLSNLLVKETITESTIQADGNISKITAKALTESNISTDSILSNLSIGGAIEESTIQADGDIKKITATSLTDSTVSTDAFLSELAIGGTIEGGTIEADGGVKKLTAVALTDSNLVAGTLTNMSVANAVTNSTIRTTGNIGKVTVGGLIGSNIFAGTDARPTTLDDFDTDQTIESITIKGLGGGNSFIDSNVAAAVIGKIVVEGVNGDNEGEAFGFVADKVKKYTRVGEISLSNLDEPGTEPPDSEGDYKLLIL